jgi:hypothetical protein
LDNNGDIIGIVVDYSMILPEYKKKITDGNMYLMLDIDYNGDTNIPSYDTNLLPKLITGVTNIYTDGYAPVYILNIDER